MSVQRQQSIFHLTDLRSQATSL